ncbi:MAG: GIY-YIG nuclease family protein [Candidatus Bathyarchaeia archaeon]|jgi:sugar fermentation stimulation protein A
MKGTYTIVVRCNDAGYSTFGKLGRARLRKGHYLYTGSALGRGAVSLEGRLERHLRRKKRLRWHVDYLASRPDCDVTGALYVVSGSRLECKVNSAISKALDISPVLSKIGASDCKCNGHLLGPVRGLNERYLMRRLKLVYAQFGVPQSCIVNV